MAIDPSVKNMPPTNRPGGVGPAELSRVGGAAMAKPGSLDAADFKRALEQASASTAVDRAAQSAAVMPTQLKFSSHAIERMRSRGIQFSSDLMRDIEGAIDRAAAKGAKDTLVLSGDSALIVSVKNKTVVTVMDRKAMKDNVFTNIDSTVIV